MDPSDGIFLDSIFPPGFGETRPDLSCNPHNHQPTTADRVYCVIHGSNGVSPLFISEETFGLVSGGTTVCAAKDHQASCD